MTKKKILTISDHPLITSGVGLQTRYLIEGLLRTGKYNFRSWGAAMKHHDYRPQKIHPELYGEDWICWPLDNYGDRDRMRSFILGEKPDALLIVTDPRFYTWLFDCADEIRQTMPIMYWHVWDNDPTPEYNAPFYNSIDGMVPLSLKTYGLLQDMKSLGIYNGDFRYIPHAIPQDEFKPMPEELVMQLRKQKLGPHWDKKFIVFWNNRNARRKMSGDVIDSFSQFANEVGKENVALFMQTQTRDPEGQDLHAVASKLRIDDCMIFSEGRVSAEEMNFFYNAADVTINIANNEGFGLGTLESMMAGTPIIVHMTGGLQFQVGDWWKNVKDFSNQNNLTTLAREQWNKKSCDWWGIPVFPASRSCTGSQPIPYIYDDRVAHRDVVNGLLKLYKMSRQERKMIGAAAREWAIKNFNMEFMISEWDKMIEKTIAEFQPPRPKIVTL